MLRILRDLRRVCLCQRDLQFRCVDRQTSFLSGCFCNLWLWRFEAGEIGLIVMFNAAFPHDASRMTNYWEVRQGTFWGVDQEREQIVRCIFAIEILHLYTFGPADWLPESADVSSGRRRVHKFCR